MCTAGVPEQEETHDDVRWAHSAGCVVNHPTAGGTANTREQIVRAAARQFAARSYHLVSLDDILGEAAVTKGAMYFHFRSKYALAVAIIERYAEMSRNTMLEQLRLRRCALETLIDVSYQIAVQDITDATARAGIHLLEAIGRTDGLQAKRMADWTAGFSTVAERAIDEGDITPDSDPTGVSRLLVSVYAGLRQTSALDDGRALLTGVEDAWTLVMPGFVVPSRVGYFTQLVRRRTRVALTRVNRC